MNFLIVSVIPTQPGHGLIYREDDGTHNVWGQVIAWRISTWQLNDDPNELHSDVEPLGDCGEPGSNCVGVKNPDGSVVLFHDRSFPSWEELCEYEQQQRKQPV